MAKLGTWTEVLAKEGKFKGGDPLSDGGKVLRGTKKGVTDGPYAEAKDVVGGYLLVTAAISRCCDGDGPRLSDFRRRWQPGGPRGPLDEALRIPWWLERRASRRGTAPPARALGIGRVGSSHGLKVTLG